MKTTTDVTHREKDEPASHPCALDTIPERVRQVAMLRGLGYSYRQIAGPLQVTPQAVSLMLMRHRRSLKSLRAAMELNSLSARAVNALGRHGIRTREQARQANVLERLAGERNCGRKTMEEIARWLEQEEEDLTAPEAPDVERAA
jgi:predicted transcriptional regulator